MRRLAFTLIPLICSVTLAATTIYKWVDENGVVHYSDQPHPNAQKLEIEGVQTYSSRAAAVRAPVSTETQAEAATGYRGCVVAQPQDQQSLTDAHSVFIRVQTDPSLRRGDQVFITLDGKPLNGGSATGMSANVSPIDRGEHTVQAQVKDNNGQTACQTPSVTFYVHQPNLLAPGANVNPGTAPPPRPH